MPDPLHNSRWRVGLRAVRPEQWTKNLVVIAPYFFALGDRTQSVPGGLLARAVAAAVLFCLMSGGVYLFNDLMDLEADRRHPSKRLRPLAAGEFPVSRAWPAAAALMLIGLGFSWWLSSSLAFYAALYLGLQFAYTLWMKHVPLLDVLVIATGFVLRALAGAASVSVRISPWLVICTFLLALFLGLCKRRHEIAQGDDAPGTIVRPSLAGYPRRRLDRLVVAVAIAVVGAYAGYTLAPETARKFGAWRLPVTLPLVLAGVGRYLQLVFRRNLGDRPEQILLSDPVMIATLLLYGGLVLWLVV